MRDNLERLTSAFRHPYLKIVAVLQAGLIYGLLKLHEGCSEARLAQCLLLLSTVVLAVLAYKLLSAERRLRYALEAEEDLKRVVQKKNKKLMEREPPKRTKAKT